MHAKDDPRVLRFRDGFWFSRTILQREHADLETRRLRLSPETLDDVLGAVAATWQIVDVVHRVRDLASGMPGLGKRPGSRTRAFLDATAITERFRNYVQHLRGELANPEVSRFPVWGALNWVSASDERTIHTTFLGVMLPGTEIHAGVFDAQENRFVSRVSLAIGRVHFNVDPIVAETTGFCDYVLSVIDEMQPGLPPVGVLHPFSTRFEITGEDPSMAGQILPQVLPKAMVEAILERARRAGTTPGQFVDQALGAWKTAGAPPEATSDALEAACTEMPPRDAAVVRAAYQAVAWALRKAGGAAPPESAEETR